MTKNRLAKRQHLFQTDVLIGGIVRLIPEKSFVNSAKTSSDAGGGQRFEIGQTAYLAGLLSVKLNRITG